MMIRMQVFCINTVVNFATPRPFLPCIIEDVSLILQQFSIKIMVHDDNTTLCCPTGYSFYRPFHQCYSRQEEIPHSPFRWWQYQYGTADTRPWKFCRIYPAIPYHAGICRAGRVTWVWGTPAWLPVYIRSALTCLWYSDYRTTQRRKKDQQGIQGMRHGMYILMP